MREFVELGPKGTVHVFGVKLVGANAENAGKLFATIVFVLLVLFLVFVLRSAARWLLQQRASWRTEFWTRQGINLTFAVVLTLGVLSIWFDDPGRLATALGLVTAGLAFALQKVVTSIAGYFVILRGRTFSVGDRIVMGGVRGDVIALHFTQTSILEMGQPPGVQSDEPAMWIKSRQYTGRVVTVPNGKIFDEAVYNYSRDFEYIWEELTLAVPYDADSARVEQILLEAAQRHGVPTSTMDEDDMRDLERRYYGVHLTDFEPRVFYRLTENWLELAVRFLAHTHGVREVKDAMSREILSELRGAGIEVASATFEIVKLPPLTIRANAAPGPERS